MLFRSRPHSVCPWSHLQLGCGGHSQRISISAIFPREFLFVCLFVGIKPETLYFAPCFWREVKPLGMIAHGISTFTCVKQRQRHRPRTCQSMANTLHVDGLALSVASFFVCLVDKPQAVKPLRRFHSWILSFSQDCPTFSTKTAQRALQFQLRSALKGCLDAGVWLLGCGNFIYTLEIVVRILNPV